MGTDSVAAKPRKRWWVRFLLTLALLVVLVVAAAPWILGNTGLRDRLVAALVNDPTVQIATRGASLGYFTPFSLRGLQVNVNDGAAVIEIETIRAEKSWLAMLVNRNELGQFTFVRPDIQVIIPDETEGNASADQPPQDSPLPSDKESKLPELTAEIQKAAITIYKSDTKDPEVKLKDVNVTFHLQRDDAGSVLVIDPVTVFDHQELTPELCNKGLHLVAPLMAQEISAEGEFSFRLDKFRIPTGGRKELSKEAQRVEIAGVVQLHRASIGLKDSLVARIVEMAAELLGESVPEMLTVANDCEVEFHLVDGRIHHRGFALMLPFRESNIQLVSSGFVGLEGDLDLAVAIQLPAENLGESQLAKMFASDPIQVSISGTFEDPKVSLAGDQDWSDRFSNLFTQHKSKATEESDDPAGKAERAIEIAERVSGMLELLRANARKRKAESDSDGADGSAEDSADDAESEDRNERLLPNLRNRIKERRERRKSEKNDR